jgi:hypothetical protein
MSLQISGYSPQSHPMNNCSLKHDLETVEHLPNYARDIPEYSDRGYSASSDIAKMRKTFFRRPF